MTTTADSGPGSLRQAILDSNAAIGGTNTIDFDIPGSGVQTIVPQSALPAITNPVLIDGESQPGYAGTPLIELSGSAVIHGYYYSPSSADGLTITGPDVTVRGLDISGFSNGAGIHIEGTGATGVWVYGDFLGTNPTGTARIRTFANNYGVEIDGGAHDNLIGTNGDGVNDAAERNLISGNSIRGRLDQRPGDRRQCRGGQPHRHHGHRGHRAGEWSTSYLSTIRYGIRQEVVSGGGVMIRGRCLRQPDRDRRRERRRRRRAQCDLGQRQQQRRYRGYRDEREHRRGELHRHGRGRDRGDAPPAG